MKSSKKETISATLSRLPVLVSKRLTIICFSPINISLGQILRSSPVRNNAKNPKSYKTAKDKSLWSIAYDAKEYTIYAVKGGARAGNSNFRHVAKTLHAVGIPFLVQGSK